MVGLVIVAHSRVLADALVSLVRQVVSVKVPLAYAAGAGADHQDFGTDAVEIAEAIRSIFSPDGVLVLMDLGSAVLSAEMAMDMLPEDMRARIMLCPAPLVEGAISAGVQAGLGSDLEAVFRQARQALLPKEQHLGKIPMEVKTAPPMPATGEAFQEITLTLQNQHGLHARPAARFIQLAASFNAEIQVANLTSGKGPVPANSLNALVTLGALCGDQVRIIARGPQAASALDTLTRLVNDRFGEVALRETPEPKAAATPSAGVIQAGAVVQAVPVSAGIALGPIYHYKPPSVVIPEYQVDNPEEEWERFGQALGKTRQAILVRRQKTEARLGETQASIFDAHLLILQDPALLDKVRVCIFEGHQNAAQAWHACIGEVAQAYRFLEDTYLQQRAADVDDVGNQMLSALVGEAASTSLTFHEAVILLAETFTPAEIARLDTDHVLGLVTVVGGPTSHSAILARALGIPAVTAVDVSMMQVKEATRVGLDGFKGSLWIDPCEEVQRQLIVQRQTWLAERQRSLRSSREPACLRDGRRIEVAANVGSLVDARAALQNGAEGVGVLRTEFLFLKRSTPPGEEEQLSALRQIGEAMKGLPIIVRTLDVGGDKALPYLSLQPEANPYLGIRAIRLSLRQPGLFITQVRAILRAGADFNIKVMFPMVANVEEVIQAKALVEEAHIVLEKEKLSHRWPLETGIMVEIPSAALLATALAPHVDFFSVGTNDLTQYTLAAERGNPTLAAYNDALNPAVLHLINFVVEAAHQHHKWVGVCGEVAGDLQAVPVLVGLGVDELSLNPGGIPQVKALIRLLDLAAAAALARRAMECESTQAVRRLAQDYIDSLSRQEL